MTASRTRVHDEQAVLEHDPATGVKLYDRTCPGGRHCTHVGQSRKRKGETVPQEVTCDRDPGNRATKYRVVDRDRKSRRYDSLDDASSMFSTCVDNGGHLPAARRRSCVPAPSAVTFGHLFRLMDDRDKFPRAGGRDDGRQPARDNARHAVFDTGLDDVLVAEALQSPLLVADGFERLLDGRRVAEPDDITGPGQRRDGARVRRKNVHEPLGVGTVNKALEALQRLIRWGASANLVDRQARLLADEVKDLIGDRLRKKGPDAAKGRAVNKVAPAHPQAICRLALARWHGSLGRPWWRALEVFVAGFMGLRWSEVYALAGADVDLHRKVVNVRWALKVTARGKTVRRRGPKGGRDREIPVPPFLLPHLHRRVAEVGLDGLLFPAARGGLMAHSTFTEAFNKQARRAGFSPQAGDMPVALTMAKATDLVHATMAKVLDPPASLEPATQDEFSTYWTHHSLRHHAAIWHLFDLQVALDAVARLLGHHNGRFTLERYGHLRDGAADRVVTHWYGTADINGVTASDTQHDVHLDGEDDWGDED